MIRSNFFSLLDNGVTVWGFEIAGQTSDAQTFAIVVQNTLASLKGLLKLFFFFSGVFVMIRYVYTVDCLN